MWNFSSRIFIFLLLLFTGQIFGWEFMLAGIIFLSTMDRNYWENILLGLIFDLTLAFPSFFFTSTILAILISSILAEEIFKSDNIFNRTVKALLLGLITVVLVFIFFWFAGGRGLALLL